MSRSHFKNTMQARLCEVRERENAGRKRAQVYPLRYSEHVFSRRRRDLVAQRAAAQGIFEMASSMGISRDVITVDGLGASGKSALAKGLAARLGYGHLNSGLLYRAVAFMCLGEGVNLSDAASVGHVMSRHSIALTFDDDRSSVVTIDGTARSSGLISTQVSRGASLVARHQGVRDRLIDLQRHAFEPGGVVAEGRDMGTVIFPDARVKFFVVARLDVRAERRYQQLLGTPNETSLDTITRDLDERDRRDATSAVGTMKQAAGAVLVDNSDEPLAVVLANMEAIVRKSGSC